MSLLSKQVGLRVCNISALNDCLLITVGTIGVWGNFDPLIATLWFRLHRTPRPSSVKSISRNVYDILYYNDMLLISDICRIHNGNDSAEQQAVRWRSEQCKDHRHQDTVQQRTYILWKRKRSAFQIEMTSFGCKGLLFQARHVQLANAIVCSMHALLTRKMSVQCKDVKQNSLQIFVR